MTPSQLLRSVAVDYIMQLVLLLYKDVQHNVVLNCPGGELSLFLILFIFCFLSSACDSSSTAQSSSYFQALQVGDLKTKVQASFFSAEVLGLKP